MIATLPLESMTIEDKISTMEILWEDISKKTENYQSPAWHKDVLEKREKILLMEKILLKTGRM
ncbi:MAG: addiction module protein [Verrucomicrobiota bacterium]|nr:addiction module protein [Verrucomicrobiota bacterium]